MGSLIELAAYCGAGAELAVETSPDFVGSSRVVLGVTLLCANIREAERAKRMQPLSLDLRMSLFIAQTFNEQQSE